MDATNRGTRSAIAAAIVAAIGVCLTCAAVEASASDVLAPMPEPKFHVGEEWHYRDQAGNEDYWTVTAVTEESFTSRLTDGCTATTPAVFSPSLSWSGCGGADATQSVTAEGSIWPLAPAKYVTFYYAGENDRGQVWSGARTCAVLGQVRVTVPAGAFDTFHVMCDDPLRQRHWYLSPKLRRGVLYHDIHKHRLTRTRYELVKFVPGK